MSRMVLALLLLLCGSAPAWARAGETELLRASIRCGGTEFDAATRIRAYASIGQVITARPSGASHVRAVDLREPSFVTHRNGPAMRAPGSYVGSWRCAKTATGHVLVLWYRCQINYPDLPLERSCPGSNEWQRSVSTEGELLDAGFSPSDPRDAAPPDQAIEEGSFAVIAVTPERSRHAVRCGDTRFAAQTSSIDLAATGQTIVAFPRGSKARQVDLREPSFVLRRDLPGIRVLALIVTAWQCRKTPDGHVLVLWYTCQGDVLNDVPPSLCDFPKEWERYISTRGELLDRGFSFEDARYHALRARLGYHDGPPDQASDEGPFTSMD